MPLRVEPRIVGALLQRGVHVSNERRGRLVVHARVVDRVAMGADVADGTAPGESVRPLIQDPDVVLRRDRPRQLSVVVETEGRIARRVGAQNRNRVRDLHADLQPEEAFDTHRAAHHQGTGVQTGSFADTTASPVQKSSFSCPFL